MISPVHFLMCNVLLSMFLGIVLLVRKISSRHLASRARTPTWVHESGNFSRGVAGESYGLKLWQCRRNLQSVVSQLVPIRECPALHFWKPMAVHRTCRKLAPRALQGRFRNRGCTGRIFLATNAGMPAWRMRTSFCQGLSARCRCARLPHRLLKQIVIC